MEALFADWRTVLQGPLIANEYLPLSGNGGVNRSLGNSPQRRSKQGRPRCRGVDTKRRFIFAGAAMFESACHFQRHRFSRAPLQIGDGSATDAQLLAGWEISCLTLRAIPAPLDKCKGCEEGYQEQSGGARWPWAISGIRQPSALDRFKSAQACPEAYLEAACRGAGRCASDFSVTASVP